MATITLEKERILKAAKTCSEAKRVLHTLFPEVFDEYYDFKKWQLGFDLYIPFQTSCVDSTHLLVSGDYALEFYNTNGTLVTTLGKGSIKLRKR